MKPNEPIRRRIYEWPDGAWVELDLDPRVSILGAPQPHPVVISLYWRQGSPTHDMVIFELKAWNDSPGGRRAVMQLSYNHLLSSQQRKKLIGLLLDLGVDDHPSDTTDLLYGVRDRRMATHPRWVDEESWRGRYDSFLVAAEKAHQKRWLGHIKDLNVQVGMNSSWNLKKVRVSWSTETTSPGGFNEGVFGIVYPEGSSPVNTSLPLPELWFEPDQESAIRKACDLLCEKELLLPISAKDEWESANAEKGRFLIPSEEEVQVFKILDEPLPFFWETGLEEFLLER